MSRPAMDSPSTSWVDYWVDNTNYCAFFGCDDESTVPGTRNGCCAVTNCCLGDTDSSSRRTSILSNGCSSAMSQSFRISSISDDGTNQDNVADFATQHDAFLDSLLREQQEQLIASSSSGLGITSNTNAREEKLRASDSTGNSGLSATSTTISTTHSWTLSPTSSNDSLSDSGADSSKFNSGTRKRRRGLLLVATPRIYHTAATATSVPGSVLYQQERPPLNGSGSRRQPVARSDSEPFLRSSSKSALSNIASSTSGTKQAEAFLHPAVRLQKDKGKGSEVGSEICAKGIPACVGKLRQKMQLLTEHCCVQTGDSNGNETPTVATTTGAVASMKRRNAIVADRHPSFVETRSILTIRMGFLSMSYGILLRWDIGKTGLVTLVVLRKNCHESFYRRNTTLQNQRVSSPHSRSSMTSALSSGCFPRSTTPNSLSPATSMDDDDDEIVRLSQPPYLIPRPSSFTPSEIIVSVLYATGLHKKSHWTVQLQLGDQIENILLSYDGALMTPKLGGPLRYTMPSQSSAKTAFPTITSGAIDAVLEIRLLEHKVRRKTRVLRCSMVLPLCNLEAVGSSTNKSCTSASAPTPTQLRIPCPDGGAIQLEASLVSDEAIWQREELAARQSQQEQRLWWKNSGQGAPRSPVTVMDNERSNNSLSSWDWLFCSLC